MSLFAYWTLFALAGVVLAAGTASAALAVGWGVGLALALAGWAMSPAATAGTIALLTALQLAMPHRGRSNGGNAVGGWGAGFAAAQSGAFLAFQGAPVWLAWPVGFVLMSLSFVYSQRSPRFAPPVVHDEARLLLLTLSLAAAAAPEVLAGWESARALNSAGASGGSDVFPIWVGAAVALAGLAGIVSKRWRRN